MIHRCQLPDRLTAPARVWSCPECDATYIWSRRMISRKANEGWYRNDPWPSHPSATCSDQEFDRTLDRTSKRMLKRMFGVAVILIVASTVAVAVGLVAWVVLRMTA